MMKYLGLLAVALFATLALPTFANAENHWHVSTYWAEYIEGHELGNHALYCGDETIAAWDSLDAVGGVGPSWIDEVEWRSVVSDPTMPVTIRLTGLLNFDLPDVGWDFLVLYVQRGEQIENLDSWTGSYDSTVALDFTPCFPLANFPVPRVTK